MSEESSTKKKKVRVYPKISILPNDYANLVNKPSINSVELSVDRTAKELNLLSTIAEDYDTIELDGENEGKFLIVIDEENNAMKIPVKTVTDTINGKMTTGTAIDPDAPIGTFHFIEKTGE